jgi:hypothetical protein
MNFPNRSYFLLFVAFAVVLSAWLFWSGMTLRGKAVSPDFIKVSEQEKGEPMKDPCWFMTLKTESITYDMIKERKNREMYGYPKEISLGEAIRIFNEEKQCNRLLAPYPPLTEDELIAAIVGGPDYGKQGNVWLAQKDALWKIASQKVMPKGSLLVAEAGYQVQDSPLRPSGTVAAEGIRITLLLSLDKNNSMESILKPEQTLVIRKTYSKVETVK